MVLLILTLELNGKVQGIDLYTVYILVSFAFDEKGSDDRIPHGKGTTLLPQHNNGLGSSPAKHATRNSSMQGRTFVGKKSAAAHLRHTIRTPAAAQGPPSAKARESQNRIVPKLNSI